MKKRADESGFGASKEEAEAPASAAGDAAKTDAGDEPVMTPLAATDDTPGPPTRNPVEQGRSMTQNDIDASKAPLIEHLAELRDRLIKSFVALAVAFVICILFRNEIVDFLSYPLLSIRPDAELVVLSPQELFFTVINISLWGAFFLAFPFIAAQIWGFVAPGLYNNEQGAFLPFWWRRRSCSSWGPASPISSSSRSRSTG